MSTLLHVANTDLPDALTEIIRVLHPGAPLAIGTWGGRISHEGPAPDRSGFRQDRFFSIRTDDMLRGTLEQAGMVEEFQTWPGEQEWHYQWVVLRTPQSPV